MQICKLKMFKHYPGVHDEVVQGGCSICNGMLRSHDINLTTLSYLIPTWRGMGGGGGGGGGVCGTMH